MLCRRITNASGGVKCYYSRGGCRNSGRLCFDVTSKKKLVREYSCIHTQNGVIKTAINVPAAVNSFLHGACSKTRLWQKLRRFTARRRWCSMMNDFKQEEEVGRPNKVKMVNQKGNDEPRRNHLTSIILPSTDSASCRVRMSRRMRPDVMPHRATSSEMGNEISTIDDRNSGVRFIQLSM